MSSEVVLGLIDHNQHSIHEIFLHNVVITDGGWETISGHLSKLHKPVMFSTHPASPAYIKIMQDDFLPEPVHATIRFSPDPYPTNEHVEQNTSIVAQRCAKCLHWPPQIHFWHSLFGV